MDTIKQKSAVVSVENGPRFEVRRMRWKPAKLFFKKLGAVIAVSSGSEKSFLEQLPDIIESSDELTTILCTQSADITAEALDDLDHLVVAQIIRAALDVNCDEEVKNCYAGIGTIVQALMSAKTTS